MKFEGSNDSRFLRHQRGVQVLVVVDREGKSLFQGTGFVLIEEGWTKNGKWSHFETVTLKAGAGAQALLASGSTHSPYIHLSVVDIESGEVVVRLPSGHPEDWAQKPENLPAWAESAILGQMSEENKSAMMARWAVAANPQFV